MGSVEDECATDDTLGSFRYIPTKWADGIILREDYSKKYVCASCGQTVLDCFKEQYTEAYDSRVATFNLADGFEYAAHKIGIMFDKDYFISDISLASLEHWVQLVEKDENIVRALGKSVEDERYKIALDIVEKCKKLPTIAKEWPSMKENVQYFIDSMKTTVAILELLNANEDDLARVKGRYCDNSVGWHRRS